MIGYDGSKPHPEDWADLLESDPDFNEEFNRCFNNQDIAEADNHTPDILDDTYLQMELAMPRESDGPEYSRVTKIIKDAKGLPIGTANDNPILDTCIYEVEYFDGYKQ